MGNVKSFRMKIGMKEEKMRQKVKIKFKAANCSVRLGMESALNKSSFDEPIPCVFLLLLSSTYAHHFVLL